MKFEVDTNRVGMTATRMQELINTVANNRKSMMDAVSSLNGMWVGEAHDAFVAQFQRDNSDMITLIQELEAITELFLDAKHAYEDCENSAKEMISSLQI